MKKLISLVLVCCFILAVMPIQMAVAQNSDHEIRILSVEYNFGVFQVRYTDLFDSAVLIVAVYDGNDIMVDVGIELIEPSFWSERTVSLSLNPTMGMRVEVMVWDCVGTMRPIHIYGTPRPQPPVRPNSVVIQEGNYVMIVSGENVYLDMAPRFVDGRLLAPLRAFAEAFDMEVSWYESTQTIHFRRDDISIYMRVGHFEMIVNGQMIGLDVPLQIIDNRTMVPVRVIAEAFGYVVLQSRDDETMLTTYVIDMWYNL